MSDIRDALSAAYEADAKEETSPAAVVETPAAEVPQPAESAGAERGPDGRFAPKAAPTEAPTATPEAPNEPAKAPPTPPATAGVDLKPPQSWKPAIREKWLTLPPEVREEIVRREREASVVLNQSAEARRTAEAFSKAIAPYRGAITGEPMAVVGNLLQTAHALQTGSPTSKAALVAQLVKAYAVPIDALDAALSGQAPEQRQQEFRDPRLDRLLEQAEAQRQQQATYAQQENAKRVTEFGATREFFDDVRDTMADIIELRSRQGIAVTLEDAYDLALKMHPEIAGVVAQREAAKAAVTQAGATQRVRNASSSVRNEAAPTVAAQPETVRGALEAAMSKFSAR
jgi:hypothetical protein